MNTANCKKKCDFIYKLLSKHCKYPDLTIKGFTQGRAKNAAELEGYDLLRLIRYYEGFERCHPYRCEIQDMCWDIKQFVIRKGGKEKLQFDKVNEFLINQGFSGELYVLSYYELLQVYDLFVQMLEPSFCKPAIKATRKLLKELGIPVITTPRKKKNNETSNKGTAK